MGHVLKRVGTGLWMVMAMVAAGVIALIGLAQVDAQDPAGKELVIAFADFQPMQAGGSVLVVDVRDADSYASGHIPGAVHAPVRAIEAGVAALKRAAKGRLVVTYCSCPSEATSLRAAQILAAAGVRAKALVGGFPRWVDSGGAIARSGA